MISNVWFQKISIPPPRREFHVRPPILPGISNFDHKNTPPPHPSGISTSIMYIPHTLWKKLVMARKSPNTALHVTAVYSRSIVTSEDTLKENILQFIEASVKRK